MIDKSSIELLNGNFAKPMLAVRCGLLTINFNTMIGKYLDYENEKYEKGYRPFEITKDNFKKNLGKKICYVTTRDTDRHIGTYFVRHAIIHSVRYSQLYLGENGHGQVDIRDILECGIFIEETEGSNDC